MESCNFLSRVTALYAAFTYYFNSVEHFAQVPINWVLIRIEYVENTFKFKKKLNNRRNSNKQINQKLMTDNYCLLAFI